MSKQRSSILLPFIDLTHLIVKRYELRKMVRISAGKTQSQEKLAKKEQIKETTKGKGHQ